MFKISNIKNLSQSITQNETPHGGSSNKSIARAFAIDMKTVARWINRYQLEQNLQRLPGSGRKPKIDKRMARRVGRIVLANRFTTAPDIAHSLGLEGVSDKTVIRSVKEVTGFENYWAAKKPFISETNRRRRVEWCRAHQECFGQMSLHSCSDSTAEEGVGGLITSDTIRCVSQEL